MPSEQEQERERRLLVEAVREFLPDRFPTVPLSEREKRHLKRAHTPLHERLMLIAIIPLSVLAICVVGTILTELLEGRSLGTLFTWILPGGCLAGILFRVVCLGLRALRRSCPIHHTPLVKPARDFTPDGLPWGVWAIVLTKPYRILCPYAFSRVELLRAFYYSQRYCTECEAKRSEFTAAFFRALDGHPE